MVYFYNQVQSPSPEVRRRTPKTMTLVDEGNSFVRMPPLHHLEQNLQRLSFRRPPPANNQKLRRKKRKRTQKGRTKLNSFIIKSSCQQKKTKPSPGRVGRKTHIRRWGGSHPARQGQGQLEIGKNKGPLPH